MRAFEDFNPIAVFIYFACTTGITMFCMNPVVLALSLFGAVLLYIIRNGARHWKTHIASLGIFAVMALVNPLFSHNGVTVLFVMGNNPVTLEAFIYGVAASSMIISVVYWFRSFSQIMTSDKLLYLFGSVSPKFALLVSMALRYVPLFGKQAKKVNQAQSALGLYKEDNIIDRGKGSIRVFSVMTTWALENGIITADSMAARGYGTGKRTHFSIFRLRAADICLVVLSICLFAVVCVFVGMGAFDFNYYPALESISFAPEALAGYIAYGILILIPAFIELEEKVKWKYLESKI